jgi:ADP-dependent glucokinase
MSLFTSILKLANEAEDVRKALGGNAAVMACRFAKEGIAQVLLGSQMSNELKKLIPSDVTVSGPVVDQDDTHLSLEYAAQESWGKYVSPRANRLFLHSDVHNPQIACMENFHAKMEKFNPDLLVVSALHMLDNFPSEYEIRRERIAKLASSLALFKKQNKKLKIHFEMASFTEEALMQDLVSLLLPHVDSLGMNEQELPNLYHILAFGNVTLVSDAYPRVATVLDLMRDVYDLIYTRTKGRLSRIHVHTLPFQAILTRKDTLWKHSLEASAKAALTAHRHTCGSDVIDTDKAKIIMDDSFTTSKDEGQRHRIPFDAKHPVACWQESISWNRHAISICVAPVLVCTKVKQTGGGGDNVSAAGLVLQV